MKAPILGTIEIPRLDELSAAARRRARTLRAASREVYLASLGVAATAQDETRRAYDALTERTGRTVDTLARRGERLEARRARAVERVRSGIVERTGDVVERLDDTFVRPVTRATSAVVRRTGMPTRDEVRELATNVAALARKVDALVVRLTDAPTLVVEPTIAVRAVDAGWAVEIEGSAEPLAVHPTKDEAVEAARTLAARRAPSHLIVYKKDGTIQDRASYDA